MLSYDTQRAAARFCSANADVQSLQHALHRAMSIVHEVAPLGSAILALLALTPKSPDAAPRPNETVNTAERKRLSRSGCATFDANLDASRASCAEVAPRVIAGDVGHRSLGRGGGV